MLQCQERVEGQEGSHQEFVSMLGEQSGSEDIRGSAQGSGLILRTGEGSPGRVLSRC